MDHNIAVALLVVALTCLLFFKRRGPNVLLFPGQGAQKVGMLAPYRDAPGVATMFERASAIYGIDLLKLVEEGPAEALDDPRYAQACVFLTSMAAVRLRRGFISRPRCTPTRTGGQVQGREPGGAHALPVLLPGSGLDSFESAPRKSLVPTSPSPPAKGTRPGSTSASTRPWSSRRS